MSKDIKGVPRHSFNEEGEYTAVDACGVEFGSRLVVNTEANGQINTTTFVRTKYERGALHDWQLEEESKMGRIALTHASKSSEGATFIDRSVILKLGNAVSYHEWDGEKGPTHLGTIIGLEIQHPFDAVPQAAIVELPVSNNTLPLQAAA